MTGGVLIPARSKVFVPLLATLLGPRPRALMANQKIHKMMNVASKGGTKRTKA